MDRETVGSAALATVDTIRGLLRGWLVRQGHEQCWYYPDVFLAIAAEVGLTPTQVKLPPRGEFARGCAAFQEELYGPLPTVVPSLVKGFRFRTEAEVNAFAVAFEFVTDPRLRFLGKAHETFHAPDELVWTAVMEDRRPKEERGDAPLRREQIAALPYLVDLPPDIRNMLR